LRGCAETVVSGRGLVATARKLLAEKAFPSRLSEGPGLSTREILTAAGAGDELAQHALERVGEALGVVMAAGCAYLNPALIVLGGGVALAAFDTLARAARGELKKRVLPASYANLRIVPSQLSSSAVGAVSLVWYAQNVNR
jgi:predicted NBD/HSP70 family sugar kinase